LLQLTAGATLLLIASVLQCHRTLCNPNTALPFTVILDEVGYYCVDGMAIMSAQARGREAAPVRRCSRAMILLRPSQATFAPDHPMWAAQPNVGGSTLRCESAAAT